MGVQAVRPAAADKVREHTAAHGGNASDIALDTQKGPILSLYQQLSMVSMGRDATLQARPESHIS